LIELYETKFNIRHHLVSTSPLASVALNNCEKYLNDYLFDSYLTVFIYKDIGKKLNISFDDFINRPRYEIMNIISVIDETDKLKEKITDTNLNDLEELRE